MINIAFYLDNAKLSKINWQNILDGNPGVGGSEYEIVLLSYMLSRRKNYNIIIFAHHIDNFPNVMHIKKVKNINEAIRYAYEINIKYFIFKDDPRWIKLGYLENIPNGLYIIPWCHNFLTTERLNYYANISNVRSVICVGREQAELYRDHKLFKKIDYIYNGFPFPKTPNKNLVPISERNNIVTYIGSIMPFKGFHIIAKAWPLIVKAVPDAQLYVIGSGKVYDVEKEMGRYGIADQHYEEIFMPYLTDCNGAILNNVHFMGKMGAEKSDILKITKVGVPNPSGDTETFGIGAIEFEMYGCEVVTKRCCGYLDTVFNKKNLYKSRNSATLAKYVIKALKSPVSNYDYQYQYILNNFDIEKITDDWEYLFMELEKGNSKIHDLNKSISNINFRWKWFRLIYAYINHLFNYHLPCINSWSENKLISHIKWLRDQRY